MVLFLDDCKCFNSYNSLPKLNYFSSTAALNNGVTKSMPCSLHTCHSARDVRFVSSEQLTSAALRNLAILTSVDFAILSYSNSEISPPAHNSRFYRRSRHGFRLHFAVLV